MKKISLKIFSILFVILNVFLITGCKDNEEQKIEYVETTIDKTNLDEYFKINTFLYYDYQTYNTWVNDVSYSYNYNDDEFLLKTSANFTNNNIVENSALFDEKENHRWKYLSFEVKKDFELLTIFYPDPNYDSPVKKDISFLRDEQLFTGGAPVVYERDLIWLRCADIWFRKFGDFSKIFDNCSSEEIAQNGKNYGEKLTGKECLKLQKGQTFTIIFDFIKGVEKTYSKEYSESVGVDSEYYSTDKEREDAKNQSELNFNLSKLKFDIVEKK